MSWSQRFIVAETKAKVRNKEDFIITDWPSTKLEFSFWGAVVKHCGVATFAHMPKVTPNYAATRRLAKDLSTPYSSLQKILTEARDDKEETQLDQAICCEAKRSIDKKSSLNFVRKAFQEVFQGVDVRTEVSSHYEENGIILTRGQRKRKMKVERMKRKVEFNELKEELIRQQKQKEKYGELEMDIRNVRAGLLARKEDEQEAIVEVAEPKPVTQPKRKATRAKEALEDAAEFGRKLQEWRGDPWNAVEQYLQMNT